MPLNEEQKEVLRNSILIQLYAARSIGLRIEPIHIGVKLAGFQMLEKEELAKQLRYLAAHRMVVLSDKEISKAVEIYLITEQGVAHLDESGLI